MIDVYTDGAASPDGRGGWAWTNGVVSDSGSARNTTNQRMEMAACIEALRFFIPAIRIHTDSAYVMNCFTQAWYVGWRSNGWRTSAGKEVANRDLWETLISLVEQKRPGWVKVKGHSGIALNDEADRLAVAAKARA